MGPCSTMASSSRCPILVNRPVEAPERIAPPADEAVQSSEIESRNLGIPSNLGTSRLISIAAQVRVWTLETLECLHAVRQPPGAEVLKLVLPLMAAGRERRVVEGRGGRPGRRRRCCVEE